VAGVGPKDYSARLVGWFHSAVEEELRLKVEIRWRLRVTIDGTVVVTHEENGYATRDVAHKFSVGAHKVVIEYYHREGKPRLHFAIARRSALNLPGLTAAAAGADAVVFVGGIGPSLVGEEMSVPGPGFYGGDRTVIELPEVQTRALKALKASGKPVVFVCCSGSAEAIPWEAENLDAIVQAWYPGQAGGTAVADVLFGEYNPAGRLPITFYRATSDLPAFTDYSMANRTYRYFTGSVLWPFGYGLSYTTFEYGKPQIECAGYDCNVELALKNTGRVDGDEVAQVYVKTGKAKEPLKSLKAFKRVSIAAGESVKLKMPLPKSSFETFDEGANKLVVVVGEYEVCVGASSLEADGRCVAVILHDE
jgi:beta-glucosidase